MSMVKTKKNEDFCHVLILFHSSLVFKNVTFKKARNISPLANSLWTRNFLYFVAVPGYCAGDMLLLVSKQILFFI